ncbi:sensor histidine kinase [Gordonia sinesedis]
MHPSPLTPVVAALRWGLHVLAVVLSVVVVVRCLVADPVQVAAAVLAIVWLGVYFAGIAIIGRRGWTLGWLLTLTLLWLAQLALSPEAVYLVFVLFFLYLRLLGRTGGLVAVAVSTAVAIVGFASHSGWSAAAVIGPTLGALVAVIIAAGYTQLFAEAVERQRLIDELIAAREDLAEKERAVGRAAERERLAGEIHDTVAQSLSSIQLLLHAAEASTGEQSRTSMLLARNAAADALTETRRLIAELTPAPLDGQSLAAALRSVADDAAAHGIDTHVSVDGVPGFVPMPVEAALVRIAQGTVANVIRHAQASTMHVTLTYADDAVHLDVVDDGQGFDVAGTTGYGLSTIRRRVADLDGVVDISSDSDGTTVAVTFEFPERQVVG